MAQHPAGITYDAPGTYNVSLTAANAFGSDTETKTNYITVIEENPVVADFTADKTLIEEGEVIHFTDLSSGNPTFWKWNIQGGTPSVSYQQNPVVIFNTPGIYDVKLFVSGLNGDDTVIKEDYIEVTEVQTGLPPGWEFYLSSTQHAIAVPLDANPRILEQPIQPGDFIGVFYYDLNGLLKCGGAVEWTGDQNVAVVAYGNESITPIKEGFDIDEEFIWRIYSMEDQDSYPADALFDSLLPNQETFFPMGMSALTDLSAGVIFEVTIAADWSGISSPVNPWNPDLNQVFAPVMDQLMLMYDSYGVFWPSAGVNTIGNWGNAGYNIKMNSQATLEFTGSYFEDLSFDFAGGWTYLPVPVPCDVNVGDLVQGHENKITMIREISGYKIYWPAYGITTLQYLTPGKAYMMLVNAPFTLTFDPCPEAKTGSAPAAGINENPAPWEVAEPTAKVHTIGFAEKALQELEPGDVIGAFTADGYCFGSSVFNGKDFAVSAFGDDVYTPSRDGFKEGEQVLFRLYRSSENAVIDLTAVFSPREPDAGSFIENGISVVTLLKSEAATAGPNLSTAITIHPNPGNGVFIIGGIEKVNHIKLMNPEGQVILELNHDGAASTELDLRALEKGMYIIRMVSESFRINRKLIIN